METGSLSYMFVFHPVRAMVVEYPYFNETMIRSVIHDNIYLENWWCSLTFHVLIDINDSPKISQNGNFHIASAQKVCALEYP